MMVFENLITLKNDYISCSSIKLKPNYQKILKIELFNLEFMRCYLIV